MGKFTSLIKEVVVWNYSEAYNAVRTYSDYESVNECMEGVCKIYEDHSKQTNPNIPWITYDFSQFFEFNDQLADPSCLVYQKTLPEDAATASEANEKKPPKPYSKTTSDELKQPQPYERDPSKKGLLMTTLEHEEPRPEAEPGGPCDVSTSAPASTSTCATTNASVHAFADDPDVANDR